MASATELLLYLSYQGWVQSILGQCKHNADGTITIPPKLAAVLRHATITDYDSLPDEEKVGIVSHAREIERSVTL